MGLFLCALACLVLLGFQAFADPPAEPVSQTLTEEAAIIRALENNPELAAFRTQRGIAGAAVVIAETYPFNPLWEGRVRGDGGPASRDITNRVPTEQPLLQYLEVHRQRVYRRGPANAPLT